LDVSPSFIEKWRAFYNREGASCFAVHYKGSEGYLTSEQKENIIQFINSKQTCQLEALISYLKNTFGIEYKSKQSYYDLLGIAGMSWKKTEKSNPKKDEEKVALKKEEIKKNSMKEKKKYKPGIWSY
jgi:putative transposase